MDRCRSDIRFYHQSLTCETFALFSRLFDRCGTSSALIAGSFSRHFAGNENMLSVDLERAARSRIRTGFAFPRLHGHFDALANDEVFDVAVNAGNDVSVGRIPILVSPIFAVARGRSGIAEFVRRNEMTFENVVGHVESRIERFLVHCDQFGCSDASLPNSQIFDVAAEVVIAAANFAADAETSRRSDRLGEDLSRADFRAVDVERHVIAVAGQSDVMPLVERRLLLLRRSKSIGHAAARRRSNGHGKIAVIHRDSPIATGVSSSKNSL